jgi:ATP-dependent exoDNAse (exonuclease V) alpha subunit
MMLARTRADVDHLNTLAKAAAQARGDSHGPARGPTGWQAGDLIRTQRNNRRIPLGDSHVRNGDRYRILATTADGGLLVDDLNGRGRTLLPADYVHAHVAYGWATTVDSAQGATCDVAVLLIRPGMDREHLYVGMTRGRHANHAYIAPNTDDDHNPSHHAGTPAQDVLRAAITRSSRQDAAHVLFERARRRHDRALGEHARRGWQPTSSAARTADAPTTVRMSL